MNNDNLYKKQVELLLQILPLIWDEKDFAVHGGTAINLFVKNLPRYSVDIDLTYIPLEDRQTSIENINVALERVENIIKRSIKGIQTQLKPNICKLLCIYQGVQVKIEVNQTKRGIIGGEVNTYLLCDNAQDEFKMFCKANIVPLTLLYGGKISAALSRQHPRDLFDIKYMDIDYDSVKHGLIFCLLGSDRPIYESLSPSLIDQRSAMEKQFSGMTNLPFSYDDFEITRLNLIDKVNAILTETDKDFLISFEEGNPVWENSEYEEFQNFPSIEWKLLNIRKLKKSNPTKHLEQINMLRNILNKK